MERRRGLLQYKTRGDLVLDLNRWKEDTVRRGSSSSMEASEKRETSLGGRDLKTLQKEGNRNIHSGKDLRGKTCPSKNAVDQHS